MRIAKPKDGEPIRLVTAADGTPQLGKDGQPRYRAVVDIGTTAAGKRRQRTTTHPTLSAARDWVTKTRADVNSGTFIAPEGTTFDLLASEWLNSKSGVREVTRRGYVDILKAPRKLIGAKRVQNITRRDIDALMATLAKEGGRLGRPLSYRSLQYTLTTMRAVFRFGVPHLITTNPAAGVEIPRTAARRATVTPWEPAELVKFRSVADEDDLAGAWRLSLSGLRRSEVLGMKWESVDFDTGTVRVERGRVRVDGSNTATDDTKSKASERTVPVEALHPGTVALLKSLKAQQAADRLAAGSAYTDSGYVVVDSLGQPTSPEALTRAFGAVCREAGVPRVHLHWLRHTLATILHRSGTAAADAAAMLGHSTAVHLTYYVTATRPGVDRAAERFAAALAAGQ